jgi:hypothetical protein
LLKAFFGGWSAALSAYSRSPAAYMAAKCAIAAAGFDVWKREFAEEARAKAIGVLHRGPKAGRRSFIISRSGTIPPAIIRRKTRTIVS